MTTKHPDLTLGHLAKLPLVLTTLLLTASIAPAPGAFAQLTPATTAAETANSKNPAPKEKSTLDEEIIILSPFTVSSSKDTGYQATSTLAGTRLRTDLVDIGSAISVLTKEMMTDVGGHNNETLLSYAVNTEVAGPRGNFSGANRGGNEGHIDELNAFANPNGNTRVRGLISADNTRNFFLSDIPWDGYNIDRVDLQRGPNAILFGLGSPAGVINASTTSATFQTKGSAEATFDEFGTQRYALDYNHVLLEKQLALRISLLDNREKFQQKPAFARDRRGYGAFKYAPGALNKNGTLFEVSGNIEHGEINSNRPRQVTPEDAISPFWRPTTLGGVNKKTFDAYRDFFVTGQPIYNTYNNVTSSDFGGMIQNNNSNAPYAFERQGLPVFGARRPDGSIITTTSDGSNGVYGGNGLRTVSGIQDWASRAGLPYFGAGGYRNETITDPTIFDFYHKLLDGPNKREWTNWDAHQLELTHTFLNNLVGYNLAYFKQDLDQGMWTPLGWDAGSIRIDIQERLLDGSPNPNVGRAYVGGRTEDMGSFKNKSIREAYRGQVFGVYDFAKRHSGQWAKLLGEQRLTGVLSEEDQKTDYRSIKYADWDLATKARFSPYQPSSYSYDFGQPSFKYYVSGDLRGLSSPSGANVTNLAMPFSSATDVNAPIRYFDPTWTAAGTVDPAAPWDNPQDPNHLNNAAYTQSQNPANYRGWTSTTGRYVTYNSPNAIEGMSAQDYLTKSASLTKYNVKSKILVWQGTFWDHALVGVYGYRKDSSYRYEYATSDRQYNQNQRTGGADLSPATYNYDNPKALVGNADTTTRNWSAMLHVNKLLGTHDAIPVNLRLYYNEGENFQPVAGRTDVFLNPLPPPSGKTKDISIMISTKDDKYSVRATKYETSIFGANSTDGKLQADWALEQILGDGLGWGGSPGGILRGYKSGMYSYTDWTNSGGDATQLRDSIIPAWFAFEKELKQKFPDFVNAWMGKDTVWGTDRLDDYPRVAKPSGVAATEDSISKGYEVEFIANPTRNWRIALNGSQTTAVRSNVPGSSWRAVVDFINDKFQNTPVGLSPIWWSGNTFGQRNFGPYPWNFYPDWVRVSALNGQSAGEVRKYRANLFTNYTFDTGRLKGFGIGGGYRWEDRSVIAYAPQQNKDGTLGVNINAPFYAPREQTVDMWFSYSHKISKDLVWKIQLNLFNVGGKNDLIPITAGVDYTKLAQIGTPTPTTVVPMRAYGYAIKQGMSWQVSNRIEF
jgi:outer membrane receptor protein involved in Fe transport